MMYGLKLLSGSGYNVKTAMRAFKICTIEKVTGLRTSKGKIKNPIKYKATPNKRNVISLKGLSKYAMENTQAIT